MRAPIARLAFGRSVWRSVASLRNRNGRQQPFLLHTLERVVGEIVQSIGAPPLASRCTIPALTSSRCWVRTFCEMPGIACRSAAKCLGDSANRACQIGELHSSKTWLSSAWRMKRCASSSNRKRSLTNSLAARLHIAVVVVIALPERSSRVARPFPFRPRHRERNERTAQRAKVGTSQPFGPHVPAGIGSQGGPNLDWPNACDVQTILVRLGNPQRMTVSEQWRQQRQAPAHRAEFRAVVEKLQGIEAGFGNSTPGMAGNASRASSRLTDVPWRTLGTALCGGRTPRSAHRSSAISSARTVGPW